MLSGYHEDGLAHLSENLRRAKLTDHEALEEFVIDNAELEALESRLDEFNIFEAIGMVWQEIRHSAFLAFLLDPRQSHGLDDAFLKAVLQKAIVGVKETALPISPIDLDVWTLNDTVVLRESNNIDILILNETNWLAVIIENKIGAGEHSGQLDRYYRVVRQQYPKWRILGLYLTPDGSSPSDERYVSVSYSLIAAQIDRLAESRASVLGTDVRALMLHYSQMLKRYIMSESDIADLCRRIYQKHKRAIDLILQHVPSRQEALQEELAKIVSTTPGIRLRHRTKRALGFHPNDWDVPVLQRGQGNDATSLLLEFYFDNTPNRVRFYLYINPGSQTHRKKLLDMALANKPLFSPEKTLYKGYNRIYARTILTKTDLEIADISDLNTALWKFWGQFIDHDLLRIKEIVQAEEWIWDDANVILTENADVAEMPPLETENDGE